AADDLFLIEIFPDENEPVDSFFAFSPAPSRAALEEHVHALKNELVGIAAKIQNPLHAHDVRALLGNHRPEPLAHFQAVEIAGDDDRDRRDIFGVLVIVGVILRLTFEREALEIEDDRNVDVGILRLADARGAVDVANFIFQLGQILGRDQVHLVEQQEVGEGDLFFRLGGAVELLEDVLGIDDRHDAVQAEFAADAVVDEKRLRDRRGIGEAGGLDHERIVAAALLEQIEQRAQQIAAHGAANAAVAHLDDLLIG